MRSIETRVCIRCGLVKTLDQFDIRSQRTGVRNGACRPCMTEYKRLWYVANRGELIERARLRRDRVENENRARMWRYLAYHPCVDCGEPDPVVLEFDHIRDKRANVSEMVSSAFSWSTIELEIANCEVRCVNCHLRKTSRDLGTYERKQSFIRIAVGELSFPYVVDEAVMSDQRRCGRCGLTKSPDEFSIRSRDTGERQPWCRACMAEYKRGWYLRNRDHQLERVRTNRERTRRENQDRAWDYLGQHGCTDCGEPDPVVLQFDHLRDKRRDVSYMLLSGFTWANIKIEIDKCEVRCGNCHRRKTARDLGLYDRKRTFVKLEEPLATYSWLIIDDSRAVSSVDRAEVF